MATAAALSSTAALLRRPITSRVKLRVRSMASVAPAVIVGGGRVGKALQAMGDGRDVLVRRGEPVPAGFDGPILVCTRNDDLDAVLETTPPSRWKGWSRSVTYRFMPTQLNVLHHHRFILVNGMLDPWLQSKGLIDADQVLAYFAVSKVGEPPIDGKTDTNPEGLTAAFGKWATAVATRLQSGGLSCKVLEKEAFQKQMFEKLIWISAFMLVGARHPPATVGVVEKEYRSEVASLIAELAAAAAAEKGITFEDGVEDRLCAYSRTVAHFPTAVKEFKWRNGWFYALTERTLAEGKPDPCPLHTAWLKELKII